MRVLAHAGRMEVISVSIQRKRNENLPDWLRRYNNLDVDPGLEVLEKMRVFYTKKAIDILKVAVGAGATVFFFAMLLFAIMTEASAASFF